MSTALLDLDFVLPGSWWSLDLHGSNEAVSKRIYDLVEKAIGNRDDCARLRHETRQLLTDVAERGRTAGATQVYLGRSLVGSIPLAATLAISRPGVSLPDVAPGADRAAALLRLVPGEEPSVLEHPRCAVVRSAKRACPEDVAESTNELSRLMVNYWIQPPDVNDLVVFTFTTPMIQLEEELVFLFDAIVTTVRPQEAQ